LAKGPRYIVPFRRRREGKTDYRLRKKLLLSGKPLFTVRRSNRYVYVFIYMPEIGGDRTLVGVCSKILAEKYGWVGLKNTPAAYLTGLIAGLKALKAGVKEAIVHLGRAWTKRASIPFAAAMGAIDAGVHIPVGEEALVDQSRIRGEHIAEYARYLKHSDPEGFRRRFSRYLEAGIDPEDLPKLFEETKEKILAESW